MSNVSLEGLLVGRQGIQKALLLVPAGIHMCDAQLLI